MEEVVLDQAGLDLLLAHPHITDVTFLAIAATESRVDSPCTWRALKLAWHQDIRTVAYVPLHSLEQPLPANALLLPPDVPLDQLPEMLRTATTCIAQHRQLFSIKKGQNLCLSDHVNSLAGGGCVRWDRRRQHAYNQSVLLALCAALEPLAGVREVQGLVFGFQPSCAEHGIPTTTVGKPVLQALHKTWGRRVSALWFKGVALAHGFFPALEKTFPKLERLGLERVESEGQHLEARIMLISQRMARPMTIYLDEEVHE
jgi:hypothetical protein